MDAEETAESAEERWKGYLEGTAISRSFLVVVLAAL